MGEPRGTFESSSPDISPRIEIVLLRLFYDVLTIEAGRSEEVIPVKGIIIRRWYLLVDGLDNGHSFRPVLKHASDGLYDSI
jgi:hypothetical protein